MPDMSTTVACTYIDRWEHPYAIFKFMYRPRGMAASLCAMCSPLYIETEILKAHGIISSSLASESNAAAGWAGLSMQHHSSNNDNHTKPKFGEQPHSLPPSQPIAESF